MSVRCPKYACGPYCLFNLILIWEEVSYYCYVAGFVSCCWPIQLMVILILKVVTSDEFVILWMHKTHCMQIVPISSFSQKQTSDIKQTQLFYCLFIYVCSFVMKTYYWYICTYLLRNGRALIYLFGIHKLFPMMPCHNLDLCQRSSLYLLRAQVILFS